MENPITIRLKNGATLILNIESIKNFFDSCEDLPPTNQTQAALNAITEICSIVAKKNADLGQHIMDVATLVLGNVEIA